MLNSLFFKRVRSHLFAELISYKFYLKVMILFNINIS